MLALAQVSVPVQALAQVSVRVLALAQVSVPALVQVQVSVPALVLAQVSAPAREPVHRRSLAAPQRQARLRSRRHRPTG